MKAAFEDGCHLSKNARTSEVGSRKGAIYFKLQIAVTQFQSFPSSLMQLVLISQSLNMDWELHPLPTFILMPSRKITGVW